MKKYNVDGTIVTLDTLNRIVKVNNKEYNCIHISDNLILADSPESSIHIDLRTSKLIKQNDE